MGTDVYLEWDGMTKEEEEKQITGFSINAGRYGYLRVGIRMINENIALREIFDEKYWKGTYRYKFTEEDFKRVCQIILGYLISEIFGIELPKDETIKQMNKMHEALLNAFKNLGYKVVINSKDISFVICWANSVLEFYKLGLQKEKEGKNPRVSISW